MTFFFFKRSLNFSLFFSFFFFEGDEGKSRLASVSEFVLQRIQI